MINVLYMSFISFKFEISHPGQPCKAACANIFAQVSYLNNIGHTESLVIEPIAYIATLAQQLLTIRVLYLFTTFVSILKSTYCTSN